MVKHADLVALAVEKRDLLSVSRDDWMPLPSVEHLAPLRPLRASESRRLFLEKLRELRVDCIGA